MTEEETGITIKVEKWYQRKWNQALTITISVLISGTWAQYSKYRVEARNTILIDSLDRCKDSNEGLTKSIYALQKDVFDLKSEMLILSMSDDVFPNPKWIKSVNGRMLKLNKAFEDVYLLPNGLKRADYVGNFDYDIWPKEIADGFKKSDIVVLETGLPHSFVEYIRMNDKEELTKIKVTKYPIKVKEVIIGIGGYVEIEYYL